MRRLGEAQLEKGVGYSGVPKSQGDCVRNKTLDDYNYCTLGVKPAPLRRPSKRTERDAGCAEHKFSLYESCSCSDRLFSYFLLSIHASRDILFLSLSLT